MQGASAIESALAQLPDWTGQAFLVWETVLDGDDEPPAPEILARAADARVRHFWDPTQRLAAVWQPVLKNDPSPLLGKASLVQGDVLWDFVAVFPAGARWNGTAPPPPVFKAAPVADHQAALLAALANATR